MALIFIFAVFWLCFFRSDLRFPTALLLVPAGMVTLWFLNVFRIATLVLIGHSGAERIAAGGFHSQAGWIAFNAVALGLTLSAQRIPWMTVRDRKCVMETPRTGNPAAAYLVPFLAILAASMLSRAISDGAFELLYPLRFCAAAAALWVFRREYRKLDWSFSPAGILIGALVFAIWLAPEFAANGKTTSRLAAGLGQLPVAGRIAWIVFRTAAAIVTVPIAEELAFRGFLLRRLLSADFAALPARHFTWWSVLVSSIAFGVLHGDRWAVGIAAGLLYALAYLRRGRIGEAVIAHAVTNALLACWVLFQGRWDLW